MVGLWKKAAHIQAEGIRWGAIGGAAVVQQKDAAMRFGKKKPARSATPSKGPEAVWSDTSVEVGAESVWLDSEDGGQGDGGQGDGAWESQALDGGRRGHGGVVDGLDAEQVEALLDVERGEATTAWRPKPITVLGVLFAFGLLVLSFVSGPAAQVPVTRAFFTAANSQTPLVEMLSSRVGLFCVAGPGAGWEGVSPTHQPGIRAALEGRNDTGRIRIALLAFNGDPLGGGDRAPVVAGQRLEIEGGAWCAAPSAVDLVAFEGGARLINRSPTTP